METEKGNVLIAEFLGWTLREDGVTWEECKPHFDIHYVLKFNSDWNWLRPVFVKANEIYLNHRGERWIGEFILTAKFDMFWELKLTESLETAWFSITEFIEWHNKTKEKWRMKYL